MVLYDAYILSLYVYFPMIRAELERPVVHSIYRERDRDYVMAHKKNRRRPALSSFSLDFI